MYELLPCGRHGVWAKKFFSLRPEGHEMGDFVQLGECLKNGGERWF